MNLTRLEAREKIILSLDCSEQEARVLAQELHGSINWLKVGMTLYYAAGPQLVKDLKSMGYKIFVDLKLHDIPHQIQHATQSLLEAGADLITIHASGGTQMIQAAVQSVQRARSSAKLCAITVLTSFDNDNLLEIGCKNDVLTHVSQLAVLACDNGCDGVVCSPHEVQVLRKILGKKAIIVTPGVRPLGCVSADQKRVMTPRQALEAGSNYLVIGRPITQSDDAKAMVEHIIDEIVG